MHPAHTPLHGVALGRFRASFALVGFPKLLSIVSPRRLCSSVSPAALDSFPEIVSSMTEGRSEGDLKQTGDHANEFTAPETARTAHQVKKVFKANQKQM